MIMCGMLLLGVSGIGCMLVCMCGVGVWMIVDLCVMCDVVGVVVGVVFVGCLFVLCRYCVNVVGVGCVSI